ncbi:type IX secretion system membrane protein PorP/SprF [Flavobacterium sp.]|jgi:type IX secretion system PorP/SprF family membrane protein|uniref:type IX secretion system membrane protein PorP/SprF n=1 Tax=Flavobacterium sp. TaxID=239 RepID=UPI0037BE7BC1
MKKNQNIMLVLLLLISSSVLAQQESVISFYRNHLNLVNPAFVGVEGKTNIQSTIRKQWTGVKDAPETQAFSFMTPLGNKKFSIGLSFVHDKVFIETQQFVAVDFAYDVKLTEKLNLFMGLKVGGNNYQVNTNGLETYNVLLDPSLQPISMFNPNIGMGFYLKHNKYYVAISTPKMLNTERAKNEDGYATAATDRAHYYLSGGYDIEVSPTIDLLPSVMIRYVNGAPFSTDFSATTIFNKKFDLGVTYRTDNSLAGMVKFTISKRLQLGFAYEYMMQRQLLARANNTNEFYMKFTL